MFRSPDQALAFAFRMRNSSVISIPSATYIANKTDNESTSDRLTHYDLHAQVGMIFNFLERRPEMEQLVAFYLHGAIEEQGAAAKKIIAKFGDHFRKYGLTEEQLIIGMLGKTVRDVRDKCGLTQHKAWKFRRELADVIQPHLNSLMDSLWDWLQVSENDVI
jgi:hypothetical protein